MESCPASKKSFFFAFLFGCVLVYALQLPRRSVDISNWFSSSAVTKQLLSQYPFPVSVSPDGSATLMKSRLEDEFLLTVDRVGDGKELARSRSDESQLALAWKPDGKEIAFLESISSGMGFQLCVWNLLSGKVTRYPDIISQNATFPVRWSPDGRSLLIYGKNTMNGGKLLLVSSLEMETPRYHEIGVISRSGDFIWSPDGNQIAYSVADIPGSVAIQRAHSAEASKRILISPGAYIRDLAWSPDQKYILASARGASDEYFSLKLIDEAAESVSTLIDEQFDIRRPVWFPDSKGFLFERAKEGISSIMRSSLDMANDLKQLTTEVGSQRLLPLSASRSSIYYMRIPPHEPYSIGAFDIKSEAVNPDIIRRPPPVIRKTLLAPELRTIESGDGFSIPLVLWKPAAQNPAEKAKALLIVHGGPSIQELPDWDSRVQLALDRGYTVAIPNYRGSSGYGASYERVEDLPRQARDVLTTSRFLERELKIPPKNLILVASSFGTRLALEALRQSPNAFEHGVLISFYAPEGFSCPPSEFTGSMDLFHGGRDPIAPSAQAQRFYDECLKSKPQNSITVFKNENHHFHRTRSWATVYEKIFSLR